MSFWWLDLRLYFDPYIDRFGIFVFDGDVFMWAGYRKVDLNKFLNFHSSYIDYFTNEETD